MIKFFSGLLPGAGKVQNVKKLTNKYNWNAMATDYNYTLFMQSIMDNKQTVTFPGIAGGLMEGVTLDVKDMGTKEAGTVKFAAVALAHGMLTKHTRLNDLNRARAAGPGYEREHAARLAAILPIQSDLVAEQTVRSTSTAFPAGSLSNGIGLGTAQGVTANAVNYSVVMPATTEQAIAGKKKKKRAPYVAIYCPLCEVTLIGEDKKKHLSGESGCGFMLLVAKFALKKVNLVPETRAQCGWIALQGATWIKNVVAALKREKSGRSKVAFNEYAVTETMAAGGRKKELGAAKTFKAAAIQQWDRDTNINKNGAVALPEERVRQRSESQSSQRGDTRAARSEAGGVE